MPPVVELLRGSIRREIRNHSALVQNMLLEKSLSDAVRKKLSERSVLNGSHSNVMMMDDGEPPKFVLDILSLGPKHPGRNMLKEVNFLADVDKLVSELRKNKTEVEKLCEIEMSAKWYSKSMRQTPMDRGAKKLHDYLKTKTKHTQLIWGQQITLK